MSGKESGVGGCHPKVIWDVIQGGGTCSDDIRIEDAGDDPSHETPPWKLPTRSCKADNGEKACDIGREALGITNVGGSAGGGGL